MIYFTSPLISKLLRAQSWNLRKVGISHLLKPTTSKLRVSTRDVSHTQHKSTDAMNQSHNVFNSPTNLATKHVLRVFLKSMSCSSCDSDPIGVVPALQKPMMCVL